MPASESAPYEQARNEMTVHVISFLSKVLDKDVDTWTRPELGEDMSFTILRPVFADLLRNMKVLVDSPLEQLPTETIRDILSACNGIETHLRDVARFSVLDPAQPNRNPIEVRHRIIDQFTNSANDFLKTILPIAAYALSLTNATKVEPAESALRAAEDEYNNLIADVELQKRELESIVAASREAAAKVGVSQHAIHFAEEAAMFEKASRRWLIATAVMGVVTLATGVTTLIMSYTLPPPSNSAHGLQLVVAKLLIFSLLASATLWCGKAYRASRHNFVINRHRQNALSSFQTFAHSTDDMQTKNAVLLQATHSIFSPQASGYTAGEAEGNTSPQVIELIRTIAPAK